MEEEHVVLKLKNYNDLKDKSDQIDKIKETVKMKGYEISQHFMELLIETCNEDDSAAYILDKTATKLGYSFQYKSHSSGMLAKCGNGSKIINLNENI